MQPSEKSPEIENFIKNFTGVNRRQTIQQDTCVGCKEPATEFRDALSRKEYSISGFCQKCQDEVFGV